MDDSSFLAPLAGPSRLEDSYLVYFHELGEGLRPLNGHLDDVGWWRHGWGRGTGNAIPAASPLPRRCALAPLRYLIQVWERKRRAGLIGN